MAPDRPRMRPFERLAPWSVARATAERMTVPVSRTTRIALGEAPGAVLASDVLSRVDVPSADRAAMDGYAVRAEDVARAGARLRRVGRIAAGQPAAGLVEPGTCIEIATGAPIPEGADAVVPVEETRSEDDRVEVRATLEVGAHIARRGEDLREGRPIARRGDRVTAAALAACAAGGTGEVEVWDAPRVLVAPTGDEVVPPGRPLRPGQVYDSNASGLLALLPEAGALADHAGIVADDVESLLELLERPGYDLVVTIGGTSVGRRDLVSDALARVGDILVHGVAVRPGKPLLLATANGVPVIGLPGFPTTCMMLAYALVDPAVRRMAHRPDPRPTFTAPLARDVRSPSDKAHLLPVAIENGMAHPTFTFSSAVSSMARAHGWTEIATGTELVPAGEPVLVQRF